jgi:hypothetical protein
MQQYISPNYTFSKLEPPLYKDIVDVFEDRMRNWLLGPAKSLLRVKHGYVAAVALATNYIEGMEIYCSGMDSKNRSRAFFIRGYKRIFGPVGGEVFMQDAVGAAIYEMLRCGFAHDAMFRSSIIFSSRYKEAMRIAWPKKNGQFDPEGQLGSAIINPRRYIECIELHFEEYIVQLRSKSDNVAQENFKKAVDIKWRIGKDGPIIGVSEEDFRRGA